MASFPPWVPDSVVAIYEQLDKRERVEGLHDPETETLEQYYERASFEYGFAALRFAMESREMEKAWKVIDRRSDDTSAEKFVRFILVIPYQLMIFDSITDKSEVTAVANFADDLDSALARYKNTTGRGYSASLLRESERLKIGVASLDEVWDDMGKYTGQRYSKNAKRTHLIRLLAEVFRNLFGTPLYDTVASFTGVILDEDPIDANHVRKLVTSGQAFPGATRNQFDPEESSS